MKALRLLRIASLSAVMSLTQIPAAQAQWTVSCTNCDNEWTQLLNFGELLWQTYTQMSQLETQIDQYKTMVQNLEQLSGNVQSGISSPFQGQIGDLQKLYNSANALSRSAKETQAMIDGTLQGSASMNMTPSNYQKYMAQQAKSQGGVYQQMLDDNNNRLMNLQQTSQAFQTASANVGSLQGNRDSLAQLNALAAASGNVATELLSVNRQLMAMKLEEKATEKADQAVTANTKQQQMQDTRTNLDALKNAFSGGQKWK